MSDRVETVTTDDGVQLFLRLRGAGAQHVLVPNAIYMEDAFDALLPGRTFAFFDLRNRGRSERVTDRGKLERGVLRDIEDFDVVRHFLHLDRFDVVGHSYPALASALYAIRYPERVRRLAMLSPMQPFLEARYPPHLTNMDSVAREVFAALGRLQTQPANDPIEQCRNAWQILRPLYVAKPADVDKLADWGYCELENERNMLRHFNEFIVPSIKARTLSADDFARAPMPTLIIHGDKDRSAPFGGGRDWAVQLPNARLLALNNVGHVPWIEAPTSTFAALEEFLNGQWPPDAATIEASEP